MLLTILFKALIISILWIWGGLFYFANQTPNARNMSIIFGPSVVLFILLIILW